MIINFITVHNHWGKHWQHCRTYWYGKNNINDVNMVVHRQIYMY